MDSYQVVDGTYTRIVKLPGFGGPYSDYAEKLNYV